MARFDGKLTAAGESTIDAAELLALLGAQASLDPSKRQEAIIRYLSASDGWRDAGEQLGGAFAGQAKADPAAQKLRDEKDG